jgi:hypothetical protein
LFSVLPPPKRSKGSSAAGGISGVNGAGNGGLLNGEKDVGAAVGGGGANEETGERMGESAIAGAGATKPAAFVPRSAQIKKGKGPTKPRPPTTTTTTTTAAISLFPLGPDLTPNPTLPSTNPSTYEPLIAQPLPPSPPYEPAHDPSPITHHPPSTSTPSNTSQISTSDLDAFAAHILEGRHRKNRTITITDYNAGEVYLQNAADKASGALQDLVAPVRAIGSGRHQLSQLLNNVQDQRESLEEAFAKGRRVKKESGAKYGW